MNSVGKIISKTFVRSLVGVPSRISTVTTVSCGKCLLSNSPTASGFTSDNDSIVNVLKEYGIGNKKMFQKVAQMPVLSSGGPDTWNDLLKTLVPFGFSPAAVVEMALKHPRLLKMTPEKITNRWYSWVQCFHQNNLVEELLTTYPMFFSLTNFEVQQRCDQLRAVIGSNKFVAILLMKCPQIMYQSVDELKNVSDYISIKMVVRNAAEYYKSTALGCTLEEVKTRHVFLERCGKYKTPNLKQSDKVPTTNPSLSEIYDTPDDEFAIKIAGVTLEEFIVFQTMFDEEMKQAKSADSNSDSDESDDD
ncbi:transcription termination factor 4, mitochondrial-like [Thrips palmi]|uniref:Transcription termination factor 4, mitochondrial-like n=1 Tax=Thrips palmi TaxID=161013 RepID=A0A6P9AIG8_THRPL|nr:transcription termination factor 4, mitochondrial-like [Thrips palmi]